MEKKLNGISLLLFALLFYFCSGEFQDYLYKFGIGVEVPWGMIALLIGIVSLLLVFGNDKK